MLQSPQEFSANHGRILQTFAAQAAVAIENARTYEQAQALAVIQERQRLARDLHDAVSQTLFSANVLAESLPRLWKRIPNNARQQIEQLQILTRGAMAEMRTLLLELRPEHLSSIDVATQLCLLVDGLRSRKRIEVQLDIEDGPYVPPKARVAFYRITQEALNNVVKHSRATRVDIVYRVTSEWVSLSIADNGVGFDVADTAPGFGLMNMRERAESVSAQLKIASTIGQGTCIAVQRNQLLEELE